MTRRLYPAAALACAVMLLAGCGDSNYQWGWYVFNPALPKGQTTIQFMLAGLSSGRLEVWSGGRWTAMPALANLPLLAPGGRIRWTPPAGGPGVRPAFSVKAWDGWRMSGVSQVAVNLAR